MGHGVRGRQFVRGWQSIAAAGFVGAFVVPVLGIFVHSAWGIRSLPTGGSGTQSVAVPPGLLFVSTGFALALAIAGPGLALALYRDAAGLAGRAWTPNVRRYWLLGLAYPLSLGVAGFYLYRRYGRVGLGHFPVDEPLSTAELEDSRWWYAVVAGPVLLVAGVGLLLVPYGWSTTVGALYVRIAGFAILAGTGIVMFNVGLAADLALVRNSEGDWRPGTRRYQLGTVLVPGIVPVVALVYLLNRHRHVGSP